MKRLLLVTVGVLFFSIWALAEEPRLIHEEDPSALISDIQVIVKTGAVEEPLNKTGITNIFSELMLRGTKKYDRQKFTTRTASVCLLIVGILIMFPLYKTDHDIKKGLATKNGDMIMKAVTAYPESSVRYNAVTQEFLKSKLFPQAFDLGLKATEFNRNAVSAWALIFVNPQAPLEDRIRARGEILRLDPLNTDVFKFKLE
ncbi:MAG: hypothetical protein EBZ49_14455 [Proteobacteria bacterium]|nr:hypothetical protein [Pseudomonadota bacterium]